MRKVLIKVGLIFYSIASTVFAQPLFFSDVVENDISKKNAYRVIVPEKYRTTFLNAAALKNFLWSLPNETNLTNRNNAPVLVLPMPDGSMAKFRVWESPIMEAALAAKFPGIKTFTGQGIDDPYATIRFDFNPSFGFNAQILSVNGDVYIDPYSKNNDGNYISYFSKDHKKPLLFNCKVVDTEQTDNISSGAARGFCRGSQLYTYRLAVACTGEYAVAVSAPGPASVSATMAAITTTVNRVNGIYEKELAMRFILIANNDLLVYLNPATDPFTNGNAQLLLDENQLTTNTIIGAANYDAGHVFGTGINSMASINVACNAQNKAKAVSGLNNPSGDLFDVDRVVHNIAHLFGAIDTRNSNDNTCTGGAASAGIEPGSGTTIMAAAGSCGPDNLQPQNDPFFHALSYNNITEFLNGGAANCRQIINTGNTPPRILSMPGNGSYIPVNTAFTLNATATDDNGDPITYCWEEVDNGPSGSWNSGATNETRPLFKSRVPKTTGSRTFPAMSVIIANYPANPPPTQDGLKGETLPAISRTIKFGLTIRDNRAGGGGVINDDNDCSSTLFPFEVYAVAGGGPFVVNLPNGGETWSANSSQTILWNVAGTIAAPISTAAVNILLSTDGGFTYPFFLASNVPNDGFEVITMPNIATSTARIKIEAAGNIYFDISNGNFSIAAAPVGFEFSAPAMATLSCPAPASVVYTLGTISNGGYTVPLNLSATGLPPGTSISFGTNPVVPGSSSSVTLNNVNNIPQGIYVITVTGVSGSLTRSRVLVLNVQTGATPIITTQPVSQTDCAGSNITFTVASPSAIGYQWQKSTDAGFSFFDITVNGTVSSYTIVNAVNESNNRYRCIVRGQCNNSISAVVQANLLPGIFISTQPQNAELCVGGSRTISVTQFGAGFSYQWQVSSNGGVDFSNISGAIQFNYTISNVTAAMNNNQYRCLVLRSGCITPTASSAASLTVNELPTVSISAAPYTKLLPGLTTTITATVNVAVSPFSYRWRLGSAILGSVTGNTYTADISRLGDYRVEIIDAKGCVGQSALLTIGDSASNKFFILPNPNSGLFAISLYNPGGGIAERQVTIYNALGAKIIFDKATISGAYGLLYYDISPAARGMYYVVLSDGAGRVLAKAKMLIH